MNDQQPPGANLWNETRRELHERLCGVHANIGGLYRFAINIGSEPPQFGEARTRAALLGHCIRELMNNLPEALNDVEGLPVRGQNNQKASVKLIEAFEIAGLAGRGDGWKQVPSHVTVPGDLVGAVADFVRDYGEGEHRGKLRDAATVLGRLDPNDPALTPWVKARKFFMRLTHLDSGLESRSTDATVPSDQEIVAHLEVVEASLAVRLGDFFANLHEIEDLAAIANGTVPGVTT